MSEPPKTVKEWWSRAPKWTRVTLIVVGALILLVIVLISVGVATNPSPTSTATPTAAATPTPTETSSAITEFYAKQACIRRAVDEYATFVPKLGDTPTSQLVEGVWWINLRGSIRDGAGTKLTYVIHCQISGTNTDPTIVDYHSALG